jgi:hypothetical protein
MSKRLLAVALTLMSALAVAQSAPAAAPSVSTVLDQQLSRVEKDLIPMANEMPEAKFNFAPTNGQFTGVRTFGEQIKHIAVTNYRISAVILGEKPPATGEADAKSKEQIMKLLTDSFAYVHKAFGAVTSANLTAPVPGPMGGQTTRLGLAIVLLADQRDHYGQMVVYFRMNGMVPPASRH